MESIRLRPRFRAYSPVLPLVLLLSSFAGLANVSADLYGGLESYGGGSYGGGGGGVKSPPPVRWGNIGTPDNPNFLNPPFNLQFYCKLRLFAFKYSMQILNSYGRGSVQDVWDALALDSLCKYTRPRAFPVRVPTPISLPYFQTAVYVNCLTGDDNNPGTISKPKKTIQGAVNMASVNSYGYNKPSVYVRGGVCYFSSPLVLTSAHSGLRILNYPGENVVISGGVRLPNTWRRTSSLPGVWVMNVPSVNGRPFDFSSLYLNARRVIRARYPNANPETSGLYTTPTGYLSSVTWIPRTPYPPADRVSFLTPNRLPARFGFYTVGRGGPASNFANNESTWAVKNPVAGVTYSLPAGFTWDATTGFTTKRWANPTTGIVHSFHQLRWGGWQFKINSYDYVRKTIGWVQGGYQESRGAPKGSFFYIDNIFEELDSPGEWFLDVARQLLFYYPRNVYEIYYGTFHAAATKRLITIVGDSMTNPVKDITIQGITFAHTDVQYMDPHESPSGGDWAFVRNGAIFMENAQRITIKDCVFDSLGNNAVVMSNWVRDSKVQGSEFKWMGESGVVMLGKVNGPVNVPLTTQPLGNEVSGCIFREIGIFQKQGAGICQALSAKSRIKNNVFYNGPRAGFNMNDHFGGGNLIDGNVFFSLVRETGDHGCVNVWDRAPYLTTLRDGVTPSVVPAETVFSNNFAMASYFTVWPLTFDDGSAYVTTNNNVLALGGVKNYLGNNKTHLNNLFVYPDTEYPSDTGYSFARKPQCYYSRINDAKASGFGEVYHNNTCILGATYGINGSPSTFSGPYMFTSCNGSDAAIFTPKGGSNKFFHPDWLPLQVTMCGTQVPYDGTYKWDPVPPSVIGKLPPDSTILGWMHSWLNVPTTGIPY